MQKIRIMVADDHPIYRDGLARSLSEAEDIEVVGAAADGEEAATMAASLRPDLVLLDISMPKGGGLGALERIRTMEAPPHVAMLTASEDGEDVMQAMRLGALGYVLKGVGGAELTALVRDLAAGRPHIAPSLAGRLLLSMRGGAGGKAPATPPDPLADLSRREGDHPAAGRAGQVEPRGRRRVGPAGKDGQALHDLDPAKACRSATGLRRRC